MYEKRLPTGGSTLTKNRLNDRSLIEVHRVRDTQTGPILVQNGTAFWGGFGCRGGEPAGSHKLISVIQAPVNPRYSCHMASNAASTLTGGLDEDRKAIGIGPSRAAGV